jgi:hypothetical protein
MIPRNSRRENMCMQRVLVFDICGGGGSRMENILTFICSSRSLPHVIEGCDQILEDKNGFRQNNNCKSDFDGLHFNQFLIFFLGSKNSNLLQSMQQLFFFLVKKASIYFYY